MGETRSAAVKGLRLVFIAQILYVVSVVLVCLTALGPVVTILYVATDVISLALTAVGLSVAMRADSGYRMALFFALSVLVCDILTAITGSWIFLLLRAISLILSYMGMAYVCDTTTRLCKGEREVAKLEESARKLYLGCTAIAVLCQGLSMVTALSDMGGFMNLVSRFLQAVGTIYYIYFLHVGRDKLIR
ncbi:MAG: hypothetical protein MR272_00990 [Pseudoflavonifractor sp.]|nr:hypothetical protein [Pseudoflavonifractor sp.]MDY3019125.1 hypothetical protein [Oscillospiraceae bacterium]